MSNIVDWEELNICQKNLIVLLIVRSRIVREGSKLNEFA